MQFLGELGRPAIYHYALGKRIQKDPKGWKGVSQMQLVGRPLQSLPLGAAPAISCQEARPLSGAQITLLELDPRPLLSSAL